MNGAVQAHLANGFDGVSSQRKLLLTGHRGAPKFFPEHTLASYGAAIRDGMDLVEPDVLISKDGHIICMHDIELSTVSNVAEFPEFADRKRQVTLGNGRTFDGWIISDFTLEELKKLRLKHRLRNELREHFNENFYQIVTLEELFAFVQQRNKELGTNAGVYIEIKNTPYFASVGLHFEQAIIDILVKFGYEVFDPIKAKQVPVIIQSFDPMVLKSLRFKFGVQLRLGQLVDTPGHRLEEDPSRDHCEMVTLKGLDDIATYADFVTPGKKYFMGFEEHSKHKFKPGMLQGRELIEEAHKRGLGLHTWTIRNKLEDPLQAERFGGNAYNEIMFLFNEGLDGVITESAAEAMLAREHFLKQKESAKTAVVAPVKPSVNAVVITKPSVPALAIALMTGAVLGVVLAHLAAKSKSK